MRTLSTRCLGLEIMPSNSTDSSNSTETTRCLGLEIPTLLCMRWCNLSRSQTFAQCNIIFHVTSCAQLGLVRSVDLPGEANGQPAVVKAAVPGHVCHAMCSLQHECHGGDPKRQGWPLTQALPRLFSRKGMGLIFSNVDVDMTLV